MGRDTKYDQYNKNKSASLKPVRHFFEYAAVRLLMSFNSLWSLKFNQKLGAFFGKFAMRLASKDRGIAEYQLEFCYPKLSAKQREEILVNNFKNTGTTLFETLVIQKFRADPERWIRLVNQSVVHEALKEGNGVVMMFAHVGNWELLSIVYEMLGIEGVTVESPVGDSKLDDLLLQTRRSDNIKVIPRGDRSSARAILNCFRNNKVFLFAMDQDTRVKTIYADFFGRKAATAIGAATFAQKFNAPVVSAFGARDSEGVHHYYFELLSKQPYDGTTEEADNLTQTYNSFLEQHIRRFPDQWVWFHRRWKNQPDDDRDDLQV